MVICPFNSKIFLKIFKNRFHIFPFTIYYSYVIHFMNVLRIDIEKEETAKLRI